MKVEVYWNLHKHCWSVRHKGKVIAHVTSIALDDVTWVVQPAGNEKVRREGKKNVHAFARGTVLDSTTYQYEWTPAKGWQEVTYNPYIDRHFVERTASRKPVTKSSAALLSHSNGRPKVWARLARG